MACRGCGSNAIRENGSCGECERPNAERALTQAERRAIGAARVVAAAEEAGKPGAPRVARPRRGAR